MQYPNFRDKPEKEAIHSGHFMVSHFEAEEQDDEDDVAVPVPETEVKNSLENLPAEYNFQITRVNPENGKTNQQLSIETSLSKLFQCMSLAYRQKLTSPKWNRFRGIKLRWKDKIRLNNVIWRCWHMQFIMKQNTLICQFASPLDVDTHNKPEAVVLEGKYWKRKLQAVTAEYKKWRMYYRNQSLGNSKDDYGKLIDREMSWNSQSNDGLHMLIDEDYMDFMSDTLFSTISNQPFVFPDSREIARAGWADFIQPSLGPLQPNLDDFMDTFEPLNELISSKLPAVPEEQSAENLYKPLGWGCSDVVGMGINANMQVLPVQAQAAQLASPYQSQSIEAEKIDADFNNEIIMEIRNDNFDLPNVSDFQPSVISKASVNKQKTLAQHRKVVAPSDLPHAGIYKDDLSYPSFPVELAKNAAGQSSQDLTYKMEQIEDNCRGYKFSANVQQNLKFGVQSIGSDFVMPAKTQQLPHAESTRLKKDLETVVALKPDTGVIPKTKTVQRRQRSRSSTREPQQRPPLLSAVSDPAIINTNSSVLLTQLLTSNNHLRASTSIQNIAPLTDKPTTVLVKREDSHLIGVLPVVQAPVTTFTITSPPSKTGEQIFSAMNMSRSPVMDQSSQSQDSPESPLSLSLCRGVHGSPGNGDSTSPLTDTRRVGHIHAEQKRRYNIKNGFDMIHSLIPHLNQNPNAKLSKAAMLQKGADYIRQLRSERSQLNEEMDSLRQQIECLNTSISNCQSVLSTTGAPVSRRRDNKMQEMFDDYVRNRTLENWKFWIFSLMIKPLLTSYDNFVSSSSLDDLYRSTLLWVEQHCTLNHLRPIFSDSLRYLCTITDILAEPEKLPEEARQAVMAKTVYP